MVELNNKVVSAARPTSSWTLAIALVALVVFTGCGGGSSSKAQSTTTTTTTTVAAISKADYLNQANALCKVMNDQTKALPNPGSDPLKVADAVDGGSAIVSGTLAQLRALPTPTGDEAQLKSIYSKVDTLLADYAQLSAALRAGDTAQAKSLQATADADQKAANDASIAYGLTVCGT